MNNRFIILVFVILSLIVGLESCSCGCGSTNEKIVKGYIAVVDNEPFAKLAIQSDDNKTYILKCSKELEKELWQNQGIRYYIQYGDLLKEGDRTILIVEKVIPVITENKTKLREKHEAN
jgi:hypothetical protein